MKLEVTTSVKAVETANCILGQAIQQLKKNPATRQAMMLSETDLNNAEAFRKSLLKSFLKKK